MIITLLTDFGVSSPYVAAMKGTLLSINPDATIVDISHAIAPQNVNEAAFVLYQTYTHFPDNTIHIVVVDPGVGSDRNILAVQTDHGIFLAPDNEVLKYIFKHEQNTQIFNVIHSDYFKSEVSHTFHGRDIFAPVAAHLSLGISIDKMGSPAQIYKKGAITEPMIESDRIIGEIIYFDSFGNAITNIDSDRISSQPVKSIQIDDLVLKKLKQFYAESEPNTALAIIGSSGQLEIAINQGNAKRALGLHKGDEIKIQLQSGLSV